MARHVKKSQRRQSYERTEEPTAITPAEYSGLQQAYDHFNRELFDGQLPDVFLTYQRKANSAGYFSPDRFSGRVGTFGRHELALNPDGFVDHTDEQILSTLGHTMTQLWQHAYGTPSSRGYHNQELAAKMKEIGLQPSSTGAVGGKETGQRMRHYIIPGGAFERAYVKLAATGWKLNLESAHRPGPKVKTRKEKDTLICPGCNDRTWSSKRGKRWICPECGYLTILRDANPSEKIKRYRLIEIERDTAEASFVRQTATDAPYEQQAPEQKPKRGRPKGSKNKKLESVEPPKPRRGRPPGSKNKPKEVAAIVAPPSYEQQPILKRKPGRPKGSKNKPKQLAA